MNPEDFYHLVKMGVYLALGVSSAIAAISIIRKGWTGRQMADYLVSSIKREQEEKARQRESDLKDI